MTLIFTTTHVNPPTFNQINHRYVFSYSTDTTFQFVSDIRVWIYTKKNKKYIVKYSVSRSAVAYYDSKYIYLPVKKHKKAQNY